MQNHDGYSIATSALCEGVARAKLTKIYAITLTPHKVVGFEAGLGDIIDTAGKKLILEAPIEIA